MGDKMIPYLNTYMIQRMLKNHHYLGKSKDKKQITTLPTKYSIRCETVVPQLSGTLFWF